MKEMQRNVGEESVGKERHQIQLCSRPGNKSVQLEQVRRLKERLLQNEINKIPNRFEFIENRSHKFWRIWGYLLICLLICLVSVIAHSFTAHSH